MSEDLEEPVPPIMPMVSPERICRSMSFNTIRLASLEYLKLTWSKEIEPSFTSQIGFSGLTSVLFFGHHFRNTLTRLSGHGNHYEHHDGINTELHHGVVQRQNTLRFRKVRTYIFRGRIELFLKDFTTRIPLIFSWMELFRLSYFLNTLLKSGIVL